jgi:hypothetical protein
VFAHHINALTGIVNIVLSCSVIGSKEIMQRGKALAFLYKMGIVLFESRLFLITSNGELRRNRHDIYVSNINNKQ